MKPVVVLDSPPVGMMTNPKPTTVNLACMDWLQSLVAAGFRVVLPEIADYEIRRELVRANKLRGIAQLDLLPRTIEYLPITTAAMRQAARFWSGGEKKGKADRKRRSFGCRCDPRGTGRDAGCR